MSSNEPKLIHTGSFYDLKVLIETGTFMNYLVDDFRDKFEQQELSEKSKKRLQSDWNVQMIHGDKGFILKGLIEQIN